MPKLNDRTAKEPQGAPAGEADAVHWDDELKGFGLRVLASGRRSWIVYYRIGRAQRKITLGTVAELRAAEARRRAGEILAGKRRGVDERAVIMERKAAASAAPALTMGELIERYLAFKKPRMRGRSWDEAARHLRKHAAPLHRMEPEQVRRKDLAKLFMELAETSGGSAANHARGSVSALFTWAMRAGLVDIEVNPVARTEKPGEEGSRERVLAEDELRAVWQATEGPGDYNAIVRLLILTGQRRQEVAGMAWSELDLDKAEWRLPAIRCKNGRAHTVPLSDAALAVLRAVPRRQEEDAHGKRKPRDLLFGEGERPFSGFGRGFDRINRLIAGERARAAGIAEPDAKALAGHELPAWTLHDLRRTFVTGACNIGVAPHVVEAVVNHVSGHKGGVAGVYNLATYPAEKRSALQRWGTHVIALAGEPTTVLPFRQQRSA